MKKIVGLRPDITALYACNVWILIIFSGLRILLHILINRGPCFIFGIQKGESVFFKNYRNTCINSSPKLKSWYDTWCIILCCWIVLPVYSFVRLEPNCSIILHLYCNPMQTDFWIHTHTGVFLLCVYNFNFSSKQMKAKCKKSTRLG